MELWIRSQKRHSLVKIKHGVTIPEQDLKSVCFYDGEGFNLIGEYETEERAIKVLDEIQKTLTPKIFVSNGGDLCAMDDDVNIVVYQMPEK